MDPEETTASPDPAAVLESALDELATTQAELDATRAKLAEACEGMLAVLRPLTHEQETALQAALDAFLAHRQEARNA